MEDGPYSKIEGNGPYAVPSVSAGAKTPLRTITAPRKRFVLGHISDYRGSSISKYRDVYHAAREVADEVIFVGSTAHKARASREDVQLGRFRAFDSVEGASGYLKETALDGEVILVKSAHSLHLERLVLDWIDGVRCWPNACGNEACCFECGLYRTSFSEHRGKAKRSKARLASFLPFRRDEDPWKVIRHKSSSRHSG